MQGLFKSGIRYISVLIWVFGISHALLITNLGYTVSIWVFGISLALLITNSNSGCTVYNGSINFGYIGRNFWYFGKVFSGILVYQ